MANPFGPFARANAGLVLFNDGTGAPVSPNSYNGFLVDDSDQIYSVTDGTIDHWENGLPFDADGRLVISSGDISYYDQGIPFTVDGMVCVGSDVIDRYDQGAGFDADDKLAQSGGGAAPYLLLTQFADVINQPVTLVDGQTLHQDNDGMANDQLEVIVGAGTTAEFLSNKLRLTGDDADWSVGVITPLSINRANGLTVYGKAENIFTTVSSFILAVNSVKLLEPSNNIAGFYFSNSGINAINLYIRDGNSSVLLFGNVDLEEYEFLIAMDTSELFLYLKSAISFPEWTLVYIVSDSANPIFPNLVEYQAYSIFSNFKCDESNLQPALVTPQFQQTFSNADGSPDFGGTATDPATNAYLEIVAGALQGVVNSGPVTTNRLWQFITDPIDTKVILTFQMSYSTVNQAYSLNYLYSNEPSLQLICTFRCFRQSNTYYLEIRNKSDNVVATCYVSGTAPGAAGVLLNFQVHFDFTAKTMDIYTPDFTISNNTGIDVSAGGSFTGTNFSRFGPSIVNGIANMNTVNNKYDNLRAYQVTRSITP